MAFDEKIYELRRDKLKQIEALGQEAYPRKYDFTHTIPRILADYSSRSAEELEQPRVNVRVAGRIMAIRLMGKAGFAHLQQAGQRLQIAAAATRAVVSRADARSRMSRASSRSYLSKPERSAWPGRTRVTARRRSRR